jgi:hypothetical protein
MGRFFLGFAIGAAIGAAVVLLNGGSDAPEGGEHMGLRGPVEGVRSKLSAALEAGRAAASAREQELMAEFRSRLATKPEAATSRDIFRTGL